MKTYTLQEGKLTSFDTYFSEGKYRLLQLASNSGIWLMPGYAPYAALFQIIRQNSSVPDVNLPDIPFESTPFSIHNTTVGSVYFGYFITEENGHPYIQFGLSTYVSGERVVKKFDLITGQEVSVNDRFTRVNVLYCVNTVSEYGIHKLVEIQNSAGVSKTYYLVAVRSGQEGSYLYDYLICSSMSGTADGTYYYVPGDVIYTLGASATEDSQAIEIATRAEQVARNANSTANAAMTAINTANLDDKISV